MVSSTSRDARYQFFYGLLSTLTERHRPVMLRQVDNGDDAPAPEPDTASAGMEPADGAARSAELVPSTVVQLLDVGEDGAIFVQVPGKEEERDWLLCQHTVELRVHEADGRWAAKARVGDQVEIKLNARVGVPALRLEPPHELVSHQRRASYRVDTSHLDLPSVTLRLLRDTPKGLRPVKGPAIEARLMNVSAGGIGLLVDSSRPGAENLFKFRVYRCRLFLPGLDEPVTVEANLVHVLPQKHERVYLGMLCQWSVSEYGQRQAELFARTVTALERQTLRHRRKRRPQRFDVSNIGLPPVQMDRFADEAPSQPGPTLEARLVNISPGGFGLLLDPATQPARQVLTTHFYRCHIPLPDGSDALAVPARLIHCYPQPGQCIYLGLACRFERDEGQGEKLARRFAAALGDFEYAARRAG